MHDSPPCRPRRPQARGVHRFVRVLLADRGDLEARVFERGTDVRIRVEVLPVLLAEGVAVTGLRELDRGVAAARGASTVLVITNSFPADSPATTGLAMVKSIIASVWRSKTSQPAGRRQPATAFIVSRRSPGVEVVEAVERADHRVEAGVDRQLGESHPTQHHLGAEALASKASIASDASTPTTR